MILSVAVEFCSERLLNSRIIMAHQRIMTPGGEYNSLDLIAAVETGETDTVRSYLANGVHPDFAKEDGTTLLHLAARNGHLELVTFLIDRGATVDLADDLYGWTALHKAAVGGHPDIVSMLIERGANPKLKTHSCNTPLDFSRILGKTRP